MHEFDTEDRMHGSIYVLLKRYIENNYDFSTWIKLLEEAGIERTSYNRDEMYPTQEIYAIVNAISDMTGLSPYILMEKFGEFLVPDLLLVYKRYIKPEWRTYDMLLNTENTFHGAVKRQDSRTNPPVLLVTKESKNELVITYNSRRKVAGVAVGIIRGIANYYQESDKVVVTRLTPPYEERVEIKVEFLD